MNPVPSATRGTELFGRFCRRFGPDHQAAFADPDADGFAIGDPPLEDLLGERVLQRPLDDAL
jgi:hypothetical protein